VTDKEAKRHVEYFARQFPGWDDHGDRRGYYRACTSIIHCRKQLARVLGKRLRDVKGVLGERARDTCSEKL